MLIRTMDKKINLEAIREYEFQDILNNSLAYSIMVKEMVRNNSSETFPNANFSHASIILKEFIKNAKISVDIFCRSLSSSVYDDEELINIVRTAISRGVKVRVLIQKNVPESEKFKNILKTGSLFSVTSEDKEKANFCVVDKKMYRYERDRESRTATACVNDPEIANVFSNWFSKKFEELSATSKS